MIPIENQAVQALRDLVPRMQEGLPDEKAKCSQAVKDIRPKCPDNP